MKRDLSKLFQPGAYFGISQALSSGSTFLYGIALSRSLNPGQYGAIAFVLSFVYFAVSFQRALVGDPLLIYRQAFEHIVTASVQRVTVFSLLTGAGVATALVAYHVAMAVQIVLISITLILQDGLRYAVFAAGKLRVLLIGDLVWLGAALLFAGLTIFAQLPVDFGLWLWNLMALIASLVLFKGAVVPVQSFFGRLELFSITRRVSWWSGSQFLLANGLGQASLSFMVFVVGTSDFAGYRAVQTVISPFIVAVLATSSPLVSAMSSQIASGSWKAGNAFRLGVGALVLLVPLTFLVGMNGDALLILLPGKQYEGYGALFIPALVGLGFVAANVPISAALLALGRGRDLFTASVSATVPSFVAVVMFARVFGLYGAAWAMAIQYPLIFIFGAVALRSRRSSRRRSPGRRYRVDGDLDNSSIG